MGRSEGQRVRLVALGSSPRSPAGPAIDRSAFTRSRAPAPLRPDFAAFLLPLAALVVITAIVLVYEVRSGRGRGVAVTMRT